MIRFCFILIAALALNAKSHAGDMYVIPKPLSEECNQSYIYEISNSRGTKVQAACIKELTGLIAKYVKLAPITLDSKSYLPKGTANSLKEEVKKNVGYYNSMMEQFDEGQSKLELSMFF